MSCVRASGRLRITNYYCKARMQGGGGMGSAEMEVGKRGSWGKTHSLAGEPDGKGRHEAQENRGQEK